MIKLVLYRYLKKKIKTVIHNYINTKYWDFYYKNGFEKTFKKYYNKIRIKKIKRRIKLKFYSLKNKASKLN